MTNSHQNLTINSMTNTQKVATLLIALGPNYSYRSVKKPADEELIEQITLDIASLNKIPPEIIDEVLEEFHSLFQASNFFNRGGMDYAKKLLAESFGDQKAGQLFEKLATSKTNPFQFFNEADPSQLATSFQNENPQLIALILAYLKPDKAAMVLSCLPDHLQSIVSMKIAEMDRTNPEILEKWKKSLKANSHPLFLRTFLKQAVLKHSQISLTVLTEPPRKRLWKFWKFRILKWLKELENLCSYLKILSSLMTGQYSVYSREIETKDLALALKGANDDVKDKIFRNMSERAAGMLKDDMEYMGPVRAKEVQESQTKVVAVIRALEATGEITIFRDDEEDDLIE